MVLSWALQNGIPPKKSSRIVTNDLIIKFNFRTKAHVLHKVYVSSGEWDKKQEEEIVEKRVSFKNYAFDRITNKWNFEIFC
jgi:hypothetical protein